MTNKVTIAELMNSKGKFRSLPNTLPNPLQEKDALLEATILDMKWVFAFSTLGILFDLRTSLYFSTENTGVLILRETIKVESLYSWQRLPKIWLISGSDILQNESEICFRFTDTYKSIIDVRANHAEFYTGIESEIGECAKKIEGNQIGEFLKTIPTWSSQIQLTTFSERN